jgi:hypothetical protein
LGEHRLCKPGVGGSSPLASIFLQGDEKLALKKFFDKLRQASALENAKQRGSKAA